MASHEVLPAALDSQRPVEINSQIAQGSLVAQCQCRRRGFNP